MENKDNKSVAELKILMEEAKRREQKEKLEKRQNYETLKDSTVLELCKKAAETSRIIEEFKKEAFEETNALIAVLREYSQRHEESLGNFRFASGKFRVNYRRQGRPSFDEKATEGEFFIKEFVASKFQNDNDTRDLIVSLLERRKGDFDINLIQKLYKMEDRFDDENWKKGIQLIRESYSYEHSKDYITFEERNANGEWVMIPLNFAAI